LGKQEKSATPKKKVSWLKLLLFGIVAFIIILPLVGYIMFGPLLFKLLFPSAASRDFATGEKLFEEDVPQAMKYIDKAFSEAGGLSAAERAWMRYKYATLFYRYHLADKAEEQTQKGIALCQSDVPSDPSEASALAHLYQQRGWEHHQGFLEDPKLDDGVKDQEKAVEIVRKRFGPNHPETISKTPTLALMYVDTKQTEKGNALMQTARTAVDTIPGVHSDEWYVYDMDARMKAVEHDYKGATRSFLRAWKIQGNENERRRIWSDFTNGLDQGRSPEWSDVAKASKLLAKSQFAELDAMADALRKSQKSYWDGSWALDAFYESVHGQDEHGSLAPTEEDYTELLFEDRNWLKRTKSATARVALANSLVNYAWWAQAWGWTPAAAKANRERSAQAQQVLDSDPSVGKKCPRAYRMYSKISVATNWDRAKYMKMLDECHRNWPNYHTVDQGAASYLVSCVDYDTGLQFMKTRANQVGGSKGDELYAQLVTYMRGAMAFGKSIDWPRVKAGYKQIFKDFPGSMAARQTYIDMALRAGDFDAAATAFDGFKE
jgi:hypothetical protein